jgi:hypothetical protein
MGNMMWGGGREKFGDELRKEPKRTHCLAFVPVTDNPEVSKVTINQNHPGNHFF